jgi:hypothetical protein
MATAAEISAAVSSIYEAAAEFERWPRTLLQISDLLGGTMAALVEGDRATGAVSTLAVRSYAGAREEYATHYHAHNIAWQRMAHVPPGASVVDRELFPREAVRRNACYGEFLKRLDVHSLLTAIMVKERSIRSPRRRGGAASAAPEGRALWRLEVDCKLILGRGLYRQVGRLLAFEDAIDVSGGAPVHVEEIRPVRDQAAGGDDEACEVGRRQLVVGISKISLTAPAP